jgi:hypothetical protein
MKAEGPFSPRLLAVWASVSVALLALSLYLMTAPEGGTPGNDVVSTGVFSRSALGHAGLAEILERIGVPVVKSHYGSLGKLGENGVLVIAEPRLGTIEGLSAVEGLLAARTVLLVLPKRIGLPSREHPGWIAQSRVVPQPEAQLLLNALDIDAEVARVQGVSAWKQNTFGTDPVIAMPMQLLRSKTLQPLVATADGILLAEADRGHLWILADPDILENHGLAEPTNAAFAVALLNELRAGEGSVVFDETIHGLASRPSSPLRLLFTFPYVLATLQGLLAVAVLLWATMGRFGRAEPVPPQLEAGKLGLIRNAARLLRPSRGGGPPLCAGDAARCRPAAPCPAGLDGDGSPGVAQPGRRHARRRDRLRPGFTAHG